MALQLFYATARYHATGKCKKKTVKMNAAELLCGYGSRRATEPYQAAGLHAALIVQADAKKKRSEKQDLILTLRSTNKQNGKRT
jgi:hypothetical protein